MIIMNKIKNFIFRKDKRFFFLAKKGFYNNYSDLDFIQMQFKNVFGHKVNFDCPKTFNEKLQWLKINDRKEIYSLMVDKYEVKKIISNIIGEKYIIPTIGVYDKFTDINFEELPSSFVIKCTHDSGSQIIIKNKSEMNYKKIKRIINRRLKVNYYYLGREWPYKDVKPRILVEKYMEDSKTKELRDYKFFCFNGKCRFFKIDYNRSSYHQANYYDIDSNLLKFGEEVCPPDFDKKIDLPVNLDKMIKLSNLISKQFIFIRVDFYEVNNKVFFGELTFYPASGFGKFIPEKWDDIIGDYLLLPLNNDRKEK